MAQKLISFFLVSRTDRTNQVRAMSNIGKNRFENNRFLIFSITFGIILVLFVLVGFLYKVVLDEANRGIERFIVLREPRPHQDISKHPAKELLESADGLVDRAYRLRVDKDGYIIPSRVHEKADLSIVFLGGSTTECHYMNEEERFPYIVGRRLEQMTGLRINSYNSGMAGNNSLHSVFLLQGKV
ncbi:MAG: hypothetical protein Q7U56_12530, partial [Humidesulfovibrio sp.]|nr:hypothetical protein [Humidesulfovibrio sp.]